MNESCWLGESFKYVYCRFRHRATPIYDDTLTMTTNQCANSKISVDMHNSKISVDMHTGRENCDEPVQL
jgi:hypothetical protein